MNWRRVCIFVLIFFFATAAAAFPFGFIRGFSLARGQVPPSWLPIGQAVAVFGAGVLVTAALARRQGRRPWIHAGAVGLSSWLLSYPINVLGFHTPPSLWLAQSWVVCLMVLLGVPLGRHFATKDSDDPEGSAKVDG